MLSPSLKLSRSPMRLIAQALTVAALAAPFAASASASSLAIHLPVQRTVAGSVAFSVSGLRSHVHRVVYEIDGRRVWTATRRPYRFRRTGVLNTRTLRNGRHVLLVNVVYAGRVQIVRRAIIVANGSASLDARKASGSSAASRGDPTPKPPIRQPSPAPKPSAPLAPKSPAPTPAPSSPLVWSGDFSTGDLSQWGYVQDCPGSIKVVPNPAGSGNVAQFSVSDQDIHTNCPLLQPGTNPNAFLASRQLFHNGDDMYISLSEYFPVGFPSTTNWFQVAELYGQPYGGSPPLGIDVAGNNLVLSRDATHGYDTPWKTPIQQGVWQNLVLHVKFSPDPAVGFVEIWDNGVQQTFSDGTQRLMMDTLIPGINWNSPNGTNALFLDQYRSGSASMGTVTEYAGPTKVGTTFASVT
jgi:hypothetical protein